MRRVVIRLLIVLLGVFAIAFATIAAVVYSTLGLGNSLVATGFTVPAEATRNCPSLLMEVDTVKIDPLPWTVLLGSQSSYLTIATAAQDELRSAVSDSASIDGALLGRSTCLIEFDGTAKVQRISSGSLPLTIASLENLSFIFEGQIIKIPLGKSSGESIITELTSNQVDGVPFTDSTLDVDGLIEFPQAQTILIFCATGFFVFAVVIIAILIGTRRRRKAAPVSATEGISSDT